MKAGSGMRVNPSAVDELRTAGFSLNRNSAPSRAPAASMTAHSMSREVSENSRSAVRAGPSSESASTVCSKRLKLLVCIATDGVGSQVTEQNEGNMRRTSGARGGLLVSLIR